MAAVRDRLALGEPATKFEELEQRLEISLDARSLAVRLNEMRDLAARWHLDLFDGWYPEDYNQPKEVSH